MSSLHSTPSKSTLLGSPSQQRLLQRGGNGTPQPTLTQLLYAQAEKKQQLKANTINQQQQQQQHRGMIASASTPGFRQLPIANSSTASPSSTISKARPASASTAGQRTKVQFASNVTSSATTATTPIRSNSPTRKTGILSSGSSVRSLTILPPVSPEPYFNPDVENTNQTVDAMYARSVETVDGTGETELNSPATNSLSEISAKFLASNATDLNLAHGLQLLRDNLNKFLPNTLLRSTKYKHHVEMLLNNLQTNAQHIYELSVARSSLLERTLDAQSNAEASEKRYRKSIENLCLDSWGNLDELKQDIASIEREIVDRGRFSVEDQTRGVGLEFGIETLNVQTKSELTDAIKGRQKGLAGFTRQTGSESVSEDQLPQSTSKLVYLKFRRLEQLIYILKRKLSILENYPHQAEIDRKYGNIEGLLKYVTDLEQENARLESRLTGGTYLKYKEDALLKVRDLNKYPVPFLHLLIVSLQQTLVGYMRSVDDSIGVGKEFSNPRHPLHQLIKTWSKEVDREVKKLDISKKSSKVIPSKEGPVTMTLNLDSGSEKLDIEELWNNIVLKKNVKENEHKENTREVINTGYSAGKVLRAAGSNSSMTASKDSATIANLKEANADLTSQLSSSSLQVQSLQFENELLQREVRNYKWMEGILKREGIIANRSGSDAAPTGPDAQGLSGEFEQIQIQSSMSHEEEKQQQPMGEEMSQSIGDDQDTLSPLPPSNNSHLDISVEDGDLNEYVPPTVVRSITVTAPQIASPIQTNTASSSTFTSPADQSQPSQSRLSTISKSLLTHLHSYSGEVDRYRAFVVQYQKLHVSRERTLAQVQNEKSQLVKIMLTLLKRYPQLHDAGQLMGTATSTTSLGHGKHRSRGAAGSIGSSEQLLRAYDSTSSLAGTPAPGSRSLSRRGSGSHPGGILPQPTSTQTTT